MYFKELAEDRLDALMEAHQIIGAKNARIDYLIDALKRIAAADDLDKVKGIANITIELMKDK